MHSLCQQHLLHDCTDDKTNDAEAHGVIACMCGNKERARLDWVVKQDGLNSRGEYLYPIVYFSLPQSVENGESRRDCLNQSRPEQLWTRSFESGLV